MARLGPLGQRPAVRIAALDLVRPAVVVPPATAAAVPVEPGLAVADLAGRR
ncbi:MAG TPA: hypothetical protein VMB73_05115 [Acetobacteraceae bacterium]|nr:hypothetical protein [Acetobacteraceae bacterium]